MSTTWICAICLQPQRTIVCTACPQYAARLREDAAAERRCQALDDQRLLRRGVRWLDVQLVLGAGALAVQLLRWWRA